MKMRLALSLAACSFGAMASGATAPAAFPGFALVTHFEPAGPGETENPCVAGLAALKFNGTTGETQMFMIVGALLPETEYGVRLDSDGGGFSNPMAFTTDPCGNGTFFTTLPQDRTGHPTVTIYRWDGDFDPDSIDLVTEDEIRAVGT